MKKCTKCKKTKKNSEFYKDRRLPDGLCGHCKTCKKVYQKEYDKSPAGKKSQKEAQKRYWRSEKGRTVRGRINKRWRKDNLGKINAFRRRLYRRQKDMVSRMKLQAGCIDCGFNAAAVALDFDHVKDKSFSICKKCSKVSTERLLIEISKCVVRCANCHRIRTKASYKKRKKTIQDKNRRKINANRRARYARQATMIDGIKLAAGCIDCGFNKAAVALDFDHMDGCNKSSCVSIMRGSASDKTMLEEIAKCVVRCTNCHRIKTQRSR